MLRYIDLPRNNPFKLSNSPESLPDLALKPLTVPLNILQ